MEGRAGPFLRRGKVPRKRKSCINHLLRRACAFAPESLEQRLLLAVMPPASALAISALSDVSLVVVHKDHSYTQNSDGTFSDGGLRWGAFVQENPDSPGSLLDGALQDPTGATTQFEFNFDSARLELRDEFPTQAALDAAHPNGLYVIHTETFNDGTHALSLNLSGNVYPNTPKVLNFADLQSVQSGGELLVHWNAQFSGTIDDFQEFNIEDDATHEDVFRTSDPGADGHLNGLATGVTIPAGTLLPGHHYQGHLLFAKLTAIDMVSYPGATAIAGYVSQTEFPIR